MSLVSRLSAIGVVAAALVAAVPAVISRSDRAAGQTAPAAQFRVCADPNNLPFSNDRGEGFENAIAELVAADLGRPLSYTWWPQRRGFVRHTLAAGRCDAIIGVPEHYELAKTTRAYYRSTYVFVTRRGERLRLRSLDDPRLRRLRIGLHAIGDDYANVPPAQALANRSIVDNIVGFSIYGDYARPNPPAALIEAVASGKVDVAIAWGPLAGFFARRQPVALDIARVTPEREPGARLHVRHCHGRATRRRPDAPCARAGDRPATGGHRCHSRAVPRAAAREGDEAFIMTTRCCLALAALMTALGLAACRVVPQDETAVAGAAPVTGVPVGPIPGPGNIQPLPPNPFRGDPVALQQGRRLFVRFNCAGCHGGHGGGGMGPSLRDREWRYGNADVKIHDSIAEGRSFGMPAWGTTLPDEYIWKLTAYVQSLDTPQEPQAP
jgi:mxaJ protein